MKYEEFYFKMKYICLYILYIYIYIYIYNYIKLCIYNKLDLNTLVTSLTLPMYIIIP